MCAKISTTFTSFYSGKIIFYELGESVPYDNRSNIDLGHEFDLKFTW